MGEFRTGSRGTTVGTPLRQNDWRQIGCCPRSGGMKTETFSEKLAQVAVGIFAAIFLAWVLLIVALVSGWLS